MSGVSRFRMMVIMMGFLAVVLTAQAEVKKSEPADDTAALVNGSSIDRGEFEGEVLTIQKTLLGYGKPLTSNQVASIRAEVLESMIRREILCQESRKAGIKPDENGINAELKALRQQFPDETEFNNELSRRHISEKVLRSRLERNNSVQQYIERQFGAKTKVSEDDMVAYYEGHLDLFKQPYQVRASHIMVRSDPTWDNVRKEEARRKVEQILKNLKKGQDFSALAREQSDGPTRTHGGDLGYLRSGQLEKQFESAIAALKPGETTEIIETDYAFHIFKLTDRKPETVLAYENVKEKIKQFLREEKSKQQADLQARKLREKAKVEILLKDESILAKQP
ncbi:MAG: peptidylprolyl isomerase [Nitrospirota bacterium]